MAREIKRADRNVSQIATQVRALRATTARSRRDMSSVSETNSGILDSGLLMDMRPTSPPRKNGQKIARTKSSNLRDSRARVAAGDALAGPISGPGHEPRAAGRAAA